MKNLVHLKKIEISVKMNIKWIWFPCYSVFLIQFEEPFDQNIQLYSKPVNSPLRSRLLLVWVIVLYKAWQSERVQYRKVGDKEEKWPWRISDH